MSGPLYGVRLLVLTELDPATGLPTGDSFTIKDATAHPSNQGTGGVTSGGAFTGDVAGVYEALITEKNSVVGVITDAKFVWRFAGGEWSAETTVTGEAQALGTDGVTATFVTGETGQDLEVGDSWTILVTATQVRVTSPQQVGFEPQVIEGARQELRGGDRLIATVEEPDTFAGLNATFQDATLSLEAMRVIGGGSVVGSKYVPPTVEEQATKPPFKAEIYIAQFAEGAQEVSDVTGYAKVTLERCIGRVPSFTAQGQNFLVPSYSIKGRDNTKAKKPSFGIDFVDALPT